MNPLTDDEINEHVNNVKEHGYAIMTNAIDDNLLEDIMVELERLESIRPGGDIPPLPFSGYVTKRWFDLLNDGEVWQRVAIHPWIMQILPSILGEGFLLSTMGTAVVGDGEKAQPLHVDDGVYAFPRPHPNLVCNTMWALSDFTEESGATRIVPTSNRWDHDPKEKEAYDSISLNMPAGSIAFVVGTCYHGAGENKSGKDRHGLTINYCNGSMRQQENLMMSVHPRRMLTFPEQLRNILGFKVCKGAGHMFAQDPGDEMYRHYGPADAHDDYLTERNHHHAQRADARQTNST